MKPGQQLGLTNSTQAGLHRRKPCPRRIRQRPISGGTPFPSRTRGPSESPYHAQSSAAWLSLPPTHNRGSGEPSSLNPFYITNLPDQGRKVDNSESEAQVEPASQTKGGSTSSLVQRIRKRFSTDALPHKEEPHPISHTPARNPLGPAPRAAVGPEGPGARA